MISHAYLKMRISSSIQSLVLCQPIHRIVGIGFVIFECLNGFLGKIVGLYKRVVVNMYSFEGIEAEETEFAIDECFRVGGRRKEGRRICLCILFGLSKHGLTVFIWFTTGQAQLLALAHTKYNVTQ